MDGWGELQKQVRILCGFVPVHIPHHNHLICRYYKILISAALNVHWVHIVVLSPKSVF